MSESKPDGISEVEIIQSRITSFFQALMEDHTSLDVVSVNLGWIGDNAEKKPIGLVVPRSGQDNGLTLRQLLAMSDANMASLKYSMLIMAKQNQEMANLAADSKG